MPDEIAFSIHQQTRQSVARSKNRIQDTVHRSGESLAERVRRKFQQSSTGRVIERGDLQHVGGGTSPWQRAQELLQ